MAPDGAANLVSAILFIVLDSLAVLLRFISKYKTKRGFAADDYWMLVALIWTYAWAALVIYSVIGISGTLEIQLFSDITKLSELTKILWVASHVWPPAITALKISILCFYKSIFSIPWFVNTTYVLMSICVLWLFSGFWVILFQCTPIRAVYDFSPTVQANKHCVEFGQFVFFYELLNACIDVAILALPAFIVPRLQLSTPRKIQVMSIFLLGGFVLITSVLRMVYSYNPDNPKAVPSYTKGIMWSTIELGIAMICGNLPTYRPLFPRNTGFFSKMTHWYATIRGSVRGSIRGNSPQVSFGTQSSKDSRNMFEREDETQLTTIEGPSKLDDTHRQNYEMGTISIDSRVEIRSYQNV
ncbi:hypothetical protein PtrEW4_002296 [Pyrenophora tritici-repentis]|nr:hypothetical protein PtrEW4_002296 [Pyrenophora tritici-repentis]